MSDLILYTKEASKSRVQLRAKDQTVWHSQRPLVLYNLDASLAVRSPRGIQFRRWASANLKEFLLKGFVMDDERMRNPEGRPDYLDEMLVPIRDLFALSSDYDPHRKLQEAQAADQEDEADLQALEAKLKTRRK